MRRLLVVDDDEDVRLLVRLWLGESWTIEEVATGEEALERCRTQRYEALVLDYRMPRMTGLEVARALRDRGDDTPIVLFSAYLDRAGEDQAQALGLTEVSKDDLPRLDDVLSGGANPPATARPPGPP